MNHPLPDTEIQAPDTSASPWIVLLSLVAFMLIGLLFGLLLTAGLISALGLEDIIRAADKRPLVLIKASIWVADTGFENR